MKSVPRLLLSILFLLPGYFCVAQTQQQPRHAPDGGTHETFESIFIPSVPNAPFTANVNTEWIRQLPDGSTITLKNHRTIARDAKGRIFQERRLFVPDDSKHESALSQIEISDPAAHERCVCVPSEHVCRLQLFSRPGQPPPVAFAIQEQPGPGQEFIGKQSIAGLETIGTRETNLIEAGTIGNESPILAKREFWYSPQLGINLITKRQDPRFSSQQNFEVTDVILGEPDARLFDPPSGYKILDLRKAPEISPPQASSPN